MERSKPIVAVVVPCYNEEAVLTESVRILTGILQDCKNDGRIDDGSFIVLVDDGSKDDTWNIIAGLHERYPDVKGIALAHNRGHQYALLAGLMSVRGLCDAAISIDADLQDDPEAMAEMIDLYRQGKDIVFGVRRSRGSDTWFKRNSARMFYKLQSVMGLQTVYDHADYRLMDSKALEILSQYEEQNLFLRGIVPQIGLETATVSYDRAPRMAGESKYPLRKMLSFSIDGITSFSATPIRWIFILGLLMFMLDMLVAIYVLTAYLSGNAVAGWSSIVFSIWFVGSMILMSIGIVGEYIGKIFVEVKRRPRYNINKRLGL